MKNNQNNNSLFFFKRWKIVYFSFLIFALIIGSRLFYLQIIKHSPGRSYSSQKFLQRGTIFDRNGNVLAISIKVPSIAANPSIITNKAEWSVKLSKILGIPKENLRKRLSSNKKFVWLKRKAENNIAEAIKKIGGRKVFIVNEYKRYYPNNELAAHVIGIVNLDNIGIEGIELEMDNYLRNPEEFSIEMDNLQEYLKFKDIYRGENIFLTIDKIIQYITESELKKCYIEHKAKSATAIVIKPTTGEILAMANIPTYNLNKLSASIPSDRRNRAITDTFEPGSTMKIFTSAAIIAEKKVSLNEHFLCTGSISLKEHTIHCPHAHGSITLHDVIKKSCNVGTIKASLRLTDITFYNYLRSFGFGTYTGVDLPGEVTGILRKPNKWTEWSRYELPLGQEISVTAIQMISAGAAIINHGFILVPHIISRIEDQEGETIRTYPPEKIRKVIDEQTSRTLIDLLEGVIEDGGTGTKASIPGYTIAGKTGTAQKADLEHGGYYSDRFVASFLGYIPADDPEISIFIAINEPKGQHSGGVVAAPVFRNIAKRIINYLDIQSEKPKIENIDYSSLEKRYNYIIKNKRIIPDLTGRTIRDAVRIISHYNIKFRIFGSGICYKQEPCAGTKISSRITVKLYFK